VPLLDRRKSDIENTVMPTMFDLVRLEETRKEQAVLAGLIPHCLRVIREGLQSRQFAFAILFQLLSLTTSSVALSEFKKYNGVNVLMGMVEDPNWRMQALDALASWLGKDPERVEFALVHGNSASLYKLVTALKQTRNRSQLENLLATFERLLAASESVATALSHVQVFVDDLTQLLASNKLGNIVRVNTLKVLTALCEKYGPLDEFGRRYKNLPPLLQSLNEDRGAVVVAPLAAKLLRLCHGDRSHSRDFGDDAAAAAATAADVKA
jgi:hypothetical protein